MNYKHTQIGYLIIFTFLVVFLTFGIIFTQNGFNFIILAAMFFILFILASFVSLKVIIDEKYLRIYGYNEEANIEALLNRILDQELQNVDIREIIVVSSGSTDATEDIVRSFMDREPRLRLLVEEERLGKASAINLFLQHQSERVLVICSADLLPKDDAIEKLISP